MVASRALAVRNEMTGMILAVAVNLTTNGFHVGVAHFCLPAVSI